MIEQPGKKKMLLFSGSSNVELATKVASNLGTEGTDSLDDELIGAKKSTILSKFKKNQSAKTTSRFLTNEFIKEIA